MQSFQHTVQIGGRDGFGRLAWFDYTHIKIHDLRRCHHWRMCRWNVEEH